jgi:hypothetical protein
MASDRGNFNSLIPSISSQSIIVGNGATLLITHIRSYVLASNYIRLHLRNILIIPQIIKNLIFIRQFTTDNSWLDPYGFSVKDILTGTVIRLCNSSKPFYRVCHSSHEAHVITWSPDICHQSLGHPGPYTMSRLHQLHHIPSNKPGASLCHACQLGKYIRSPFCPSWSYAPPPFERIY